MTLRFTKLTRPDIRNLKPGEKITEHGITAEALPNGDVRYTVGFRVDGARVHRVVGLESDGVTRTQCEQFIETQRTAAREDRLSLPSGRKTHMGFREAGEKYLKLMEETGGKNLKVKRRHMNKALIPFFGAQPLGALNKTAVDRFKKKRSDDGLAPATINREIATLSHFLGVAEDEKWGKQRFRIVRNKESGGRIIALDEAQQTALLDAAVGDTDTRCYMFVAFGLNTCMRHAEILKSRYDRVDYAKLRIFIPEAKAGQREQPITQELADLIKHEQEMAQDPEGWIFPAIRRDTKSNGHRKRMDRAFRRAVITAGLDPKLVTPHVMRHTGITALVKSGADLPTIQKISGHKTLAMLLRYVHIHGNHIDKAIRTIGRGLRVKPQLRVVS